MITLNRLFPRSYYFCTSLAQNHSTISNPENPIPKHILTPIKVPQTISLSNLSSLLQINEKQIIRTFKLLTNQTINYSAITQDQVSYILPLFESYLPKQNPQPRPPIVTIMGHVDHGKTTLLDNIRKSQIAAGEVGGITQKIGAFHVSLSSGSITFIDTPGHEAFANMRARGAQYTDIIILVVSAADGIQPQTKEVIEIASSQSIPMIVAVNKIDVVGVNPEEIELELKEQGLQLETYGGNIPVVHISAKTGQNIDLLLELIQYYGELLELQAVPNQQAQGFVLEARQTNLEEERGSTILILDGTLKVGDCIVVGQQYGKVKTIKDDRGNTLNEATPSQAVEIIGLKELPEAGQKFFVTSELMAKLIVQNRQKQSDESEIENQSVIKGEDGKIKFENYYQRKGAYGDPALMREKYQEIQDLILQAIQSSEDPEEIAQLTQQLEKHRQYSQEMIDLSKTYRGLNIIIKGQDYGTLETLQQLVDRVIKENPNSLNIISASVGDVTLKDIKDAAQNEATIVSLNVKVPNELQRLVQTSKIQLMQHQIIYHLIDDLKKSITDPKKSQKVDSTGFAKVLNIFDLKLGKGITRRVYGLQISKGIINKKHLLRVIRDGSIIQKDLEIVNLKLFKQEVNEVEVGKECGIAISSNVDIRVNDELEFYKA